MAARKRRAASNVIPLRPATTPEGRENQLISLATDLAERQIREGSASSQVISHFLKLGSTREQLEQERLAHENELTRVKIEAIESQKRVEELYMQALNAMRSYAGDLQPPPENDEVQDV
jgi:hypothetical protein